MIRRWSCLVLLVAATHAAAQNKVVPVSLKIRPVAAPMPALKYYLLPRVADQTPGNAALFYYRAVILEAQARPHRGEHASEESEKFSQWLEIPLDRLPREEVRAVLRNYDKVFHELDLGAYCRTCDWQWDLRHEGFDLLLPEIQAMRRLAQLWVLRARLQVADGRLDDAMKTLRGGYALARNIAEKSVLIQLLVGVAVTSLLNRAVGDMIQAPGAPNLYWALTALPRPFADLREPVQGEQALIFNAFPALKNLQTAPMTTEGIQALLEDVFQKMGLADSSNPPLLTKLALAAVALKYYPQAKRFLLDQGRTPEEVRAMPTLQAVALYALYQFDVQRDDLFKWQYVPYWEAGPRMQEAERRLQRARENGEEVLPFASMILPALARVYQAAARTDRTIAALRCVEAVRLYVAAHPGKLPEKLADITEVPIPVDPMTGRSFEYEAKGDKAVLRGPTPPGETPGPSNTQIYELVLEP